MGIISIILQIFWNIIKGNYLLLANHYPYPKIAIHKKVDGPVPVPLDCHAPNTTHGFWLFVFVEGAWQSHTWQDQENLSKLLSDRRLACICRLPLITPKATMSSTQKYIIKMYYSVYFSVLIIFDHKKVIRVKNRSH